MPPSFTKPRGKDRHGNPRYTVDPFKFIFQVDTFWYTIDIDNYDEVMENGLLERLREGRERTGDGEVSQYIDIQLSRYENPLLFEIGGGQTPKYAYSIRTEDMAFYFSKKKKTGQLPVKCQINQFILWSKGIEEAYIESLHILAALGFICGKARPRRLDMCVHTDQFQFILDDLKGFVYPRDPLKTNKPDFYKLDPDTGTFETVNYGSRDRLLLRIYNKTLEIINKKKYHFIELYKRHAIDPTKVWNIEFEIHWEYMKDFVDPLTGEKGFFEDLENLFNHNGFSLLWSKITSDFQLTSNMTFWKQVMLGDPSKFRRLHEKLIRQKTVDTSLDREVPQIRGRLKKFGILLEKDQVSVMDAFKQFLQRNEEYEKEKKKDFSEDVNQDRGRYQEQMINSLITKKIAPKKGQLYQSCWTHD